MVQFHLTQPPGLSHIVGSQFQGFIVVLIGRQFVMLMLMHNYRFNPLELVIDKSPRSFLTTAFMPWFVILFIIFASSCIEEVTDFKDENSGIKVLNSLASAYDEIDIYMNSTSGIFKTKYDTGILPESVFLYVDDVFKEDVTYFGDSKYSSQYRINPGDNLRVEAIFGDGEILHSFDSVPGIVEILTAEYVYPAYKSRYGTVYGQINMTFRDPPGTKNYYEIMFLRDSRYIQTYKIQNSFINIDSENDQFSPNTILFNDELINGKLVTLEIFVEGHHPPKLILRNCSKHYYQYMKSTEIHFATQNTSGNFRNLFSGNPVELYSNIHGGLGIFATYADFKKESILFNTNEPH